MNEYVQNLFSGIDWRSHRTQLVITAVSASLATAGAFSSYQIISRRHKRRELEREVKRAVGRLESGGGASINLNESHHKDEDADERERRRKEKRKGDAEYEDVLIREQLARCYAVFREDGMQKIRKARVVVVGCGGVGSWAAMMLVRSGVSYIRLVDFDQVTLSSLNRHATATLADVGVPKVRSVARALRAVASFVEVDARQETWRLNEEGKSLLDGVDWVIDAIDNIKTKVELLSYCHKNDLKVISSMGAGSKLDPTRIQIADISGTTEDPLSRAVRARLRKEGVSSGIPVVYSTEPPLEDLKLLPLPEEERLKGDVKHLAPHDDFRVRVIPVYGPIPSVFGLHIASYVVCEIGGKPIQNPLAAKNRKNLYAKLYLDLKVREEKAAGGEQMNRLPVDESDVAYIFEDLHRGRSTIPPHRIPNRAALIRWDPSFPLSVSNCIVLDASGELKKHMEGLKEGKTPREVWGTEVANLVQRRGEEARVWMTRVLG